VRQKQLRIAGGRRGFSAPAISEILFSRANNGPQEEPIASSFASVMRGLKPDPFGQQRLMVDEFPLRLKPNSSRGKFAALRRPPHALRPFGCRPPGLGFFVPHRGERGFYRDYDPPDIRSADPAGPVAARMLH
jgi:hypothetical protein